MSGFSERLIGLQLGGFAIRRYMARGGMGVVYEGYQSSLDRVVAIKVLYPHLSDGAAFIERFQREARAIAQLRHPHIVQIIDTGADQGYHYMAMELIDGRSLRDELIDRQGRADKFSTAAALQIINQIGGALAYAHRRGFVHRDIKPGNVLLDADGGAHLSDFGLVKSLGNEGLTQAGAVLGTPEYMAPEQYMATEDVGPAADQYAFAVLAYELLTGRVPFSAPTPVAVIQQHLHDPPPSPQAFDPALPAEVEAVLLRGLAKQPTQRYPSVEAFVRELNAAVGSAPTVPLAAPAQARAVSPEAETPLIATLASLTAPGVRDAQEALGTVDAQPAAAGAVDALAHPQPQPNSTRLPEAVSQAAGAASVAEPTSAVAERGPVAVAPAVAPAGPGPRRRWLMPLAGLAVLVAIGAVVAAFALGGGNGDPPPTPGDQNGQQGGALLDATVTAEPTATNESDAAPTGDVAVIDATTAPVDPTATATEAPTPRPTTTAVSRPIEATATPRLALQPLPFATGTAQPSDGADQSVVVYQDFSTGDPGPFFVGKSDFGESAIANGAYALVVPEGNWQAGVPDPPIDLADGGVALDVALDGVGAAGMVARLTMQADGSYTLLACWINTQGAAGCHANVSNTWTELFSVADGTLALQDVNRLVMVMVGDQLIFQANDTVIGQTTTNASASGGWGMYAASSTGTLTASFAQIVISTVSSDYFEQ